MRPGVMLGSITASTWAQSMPVLPNVADGACRGCGHHKCSCLQIEAPPPAQLPAYDAWKRMVDNTIGALAQPTPTKFMREYMGEWRVQPEALPPLPPQPQGARDVRVGDTWRYDNSGSEWLILNVETREARCVGVDKDGIAALGVIRRCHSLGARGVAWTLLSRAEPAQVDDGAVRAGDVYRWDGSRPGHEWRVDGLMGASCRMVCTRATEEVPFGHETQSYPVAFLRDPELWTRIARGPA